MEEEVVRLDQFGDVLTVDQVMRVLRLGRASVYEGIRRGQIPAVRIGRKLRIPKAGLQHLLSGPAAAGS